MAPTLRTVDKSVLVFPSFATIRGDYALVDEDHRRGSFERPESVEQRLFSSFSNTNMLAE